MISGGIEVKNFAQIHLMLEAKRKGKETPSNVKESRMTAVKVFK